MKFSPIDLAERGLVPDWLIRVGIRQLLKGRLREEQEQAANSPGQSPTLRFAEEMKQRPLVEAVDKANEQHYEVPASFYERVLGPSLKYSCCWWEPSTKRLAEAEQQMLSLTCQRAEIADGMQIIELGCGWGSLSLWIASHFPKASILAVSNSHSQREFIQQQASQRSLANLRVVTCNVADFQPDQLADRIVSVEMFEHLRNYDEMLRRTTAWLRNDGKLFVHIFCHKQYPYLFEPRGETDWMARHFFTGGIMPSYDLLDSFPERMQLAQRWQVNGMHYSHTCEAWLQRLDANYLDLFELFARSLGDDETKRQLARWRIFLLACSELFRFHGGKEWFVGHYLMQKQQ